MLNGLQALVLNKTESTLLDRAYKNFLKKLLGLRDKTADEAIYILIGLLPIAAELDLAVLSLFAAITRLQNDHPLYMITLRQATVTHNKGWVAMAIAVGEKYNIKSTMLASLLSPWKKSRWKSFTQLVVSEHWLIHIRQSAGEKSSLKYLNTDHFSFKSAHHLWPNYGCSSRKRVAASFRAKFITGSYILQTNRARFNQNAVDPTCPLCHLAEEDLPHLLFNCPALQGQRDKLLTRIKKTDADSGPCNPPGPI